MRLLCEPTSLRKSLVRKRLARLISNEPSGGRVRDDLLAAFRRRPPLDVAAMGALASTDVLDATFLVAFLVGLGAFHNCGGSCVLRWRP
jgi:hypothetical protein